MWTVVDHDHTQCSEIIVLSHTYRVNYVITRCGKTTIENLNEPTGRNLPEFRLIVRERFYTDPVRVRISQPHHPVSSACLSRYAETDGRVGIDHTIYAN